MTEDEMGGWHHDFVVMSLSKLWKRLKDREAWRAVVHGVTKSWTRLGNLTAKQHRAAQGRVYICNVVVV